LGTCPIHHIKKVPKVVSRLRASTTLFPCIDLHVAHTTCRKALWHSSPWAITTRWGPHESLAASAAAIKNAVAAAAGTAVQQQPDQKCGCSSSRDCCPTASPQQTNSNRATAKQQRPRTRRTRVATAGPLWTSHRMENWCACQCGNGNLAASTSGWPSSVYELFLTTVLARNTSFLVASLALNPSFKLGFLEHPAAHGHQTPPAWNTLGSGQRSLAILV